MVDTLGFTTTSAVLADHHLGLLHMHCTKKTLLGKITGKYCWGGGGGGRRFCSWPMSASAPVRPGRLVLVPAIFVSFEINFVLFQKTVG
jgi:hypothetical protein